MGWIKKKQDQRGTQPAGDKQSNWTRSKRKDAERQRQREARKNRRKS